MKIILTIFISALLLNATPSSCDKNEKFMATGVIIGKDMRMCMCCGGYLINLNTRSTNINADSTLHFTEFPENIELKNETDFPIFVNLDFEATNEFCGKGIKITKVEKNHK